MTTLIDIEKSINETLNAFADTEEGGVDEELQQKFMKEFEQIINALGEQEKDKIDAYGQFVSKLDAEADRLSIIIKNLQARKSSATNKVKAIKNHLLFTMNTFGLKKVKGKIFLANIRTSDVVQIDETIELPVAYVHTKTIVEPDKVKIKEALKAGTVITGATLIQSQSVTIK